MTQMGCRFSSRPRRRVTRGPTRVAAPSCPLLRKSWPQSVLNPQPSRPLLCGSAQALVLIAPGDGVPSALLLGARQILYPAAMQVAAQPPASYSPPRESRLFWQTAEAKQRLLVA